MIGVNDVNALNSRGDESGGGGESSPGSGGILAAICAAFCKDNPLGQQMGLSDTNASPKELPVTSQSESAEC